MANFFPVTHSTLAVETLKTEVLSDYDLDEIIELKLLTLGLNDTYIVNAVNSKKYIL